jgi:hypothetical protein
MSFGTGFLVLSFAGVAFISGSNMGFKSSRFESHLDGSRYSRIQTVLNEKESRTPAQKKIDSQLLYALKQKRGVTKGVPSERIELELDQKGRVLVDIAAIVTPQVLAQIHNLGGQVNSEDARYHTIRARLALEKLEALAKLKDVRFIAPAAQAMNSGRPN